MAQSTMFLGFCIATQILFASCCWASTPAEAAAAKPAAARPVYDSSRHDAAIVRLRDTAYGKDEKGNFKEPSSRVRDAAKEALKLEVITQIQEQDAEQAAKARLTAKAATSTSGTGDVTTTYYSLTTAISVVAASDPAGKMTPANAIPRSGFPVKAAPAKVVAVKMAPGKVATDLSAESETENNWILPEILEGSRLNRLLNYQVGEGPVQPLRPAGP